MIIGLFIFSIIIFISPYIISKLFKLNNYQGYLWGFFCFLASIGLSIIIVIACSISIVIFQISDGTASAFTILLIIYGVLYQNHVEFIQNIKNENNHAVIFMYLSGYFLVNAIIAFFFSFDTSLFKNLGLPQKNYEMLIFIMNYEPFCNFLLIFGVCICIFFYLKNNDKILKCISIGIYSVHFVVEIIGVYLKSKIIFLFPLISLIFGIFLYIKYREKDNLESLKELGNTTDGNLV